MEEKGSMMNRTIKAAVGMVAIAAMSVGTLGACGSSSSSDDGKGKVYYLNFKPESNDEWQKLAKDYTKETGVEVKVQTAASGTYEQTLKSEIAKSEAPTLFQVNGPVGYQNWKSYTDDMTDTEPYKQLINKDVALKDGSKVVGVPYAMETYGLIYNKDLFDQAGIDYPTDDWKWEDAMAAAEKIRALGDNIFGYYHPISFNEFYKTVKQNGGSLFNDDFTEFTMDTPENIETLQYMVDMQQKTNVMPTEEQMAGMGDWDLFESGRLGMIVTGIWAFPEFTNNCDFDWDIVVEPGHTQKATHFFSNGYVVSKDSQVADEAVKFNTYISSNREATQIRLDAGWELPPVQDEDIIAQYKEKTPPANREAVFKSLDYLVTPPVITQYAELQDIVGQHLSAAAAGTVTPEQALKDMQAECEQKIDLTK